MTAPPTDRFRRVDAVFDAVVDMPTQEQAAFVSRACGDDDGAARRGARAAARVPAAPTASSIRRPLESPRHCSRRRQRLAGPVPDRIGSFRVVREIGRGGMGRVYLARARRWTVRAARRAQADSARHAGHPQALRGGATHPRAARAPGHRAARRWRDHGRRAAVLRDGARRGRADRPLLRRARRCRSTAARAVRRRVRCGDLRAPAPRHPSRPQAVEHPRHGRRPA